MNFEALSVWYDYKWQNEDEQPFWCLEAIIAIDFMSVFVLTNYIYIMDENTFVGFNCIRWDWEAP